MIFSKRLIIGVLSIFSIALLSCEAASSSETQFKAENSTDFDEKAIFEEVDVLKFRLDARTQFYSSSTRLDRHGDQEWFSFINVMANALYVYDARTAALLNVIELQKEGPDGIGTLQIAGHVMLPDGGALLFNIWQGNLYNISPEGKVRKKYELRNYKVESTTSNPEPSNRAPLKLIGDDLYIVCSINSYEGNYDGISSVMVYNLKTEKFRYVYGFPDSYNAGYWGAVFKYKPSLDYNALKERMVLSYPIDPNIYEMNLQGEEVARHFESSSYISDMRPLREDINYGLQKDHSVADPEQREYSFTTSDFMKIMYDPYRNVYYRVAYIRPGKERYQSGDKVINYTISVLDEYFVKIGERFFEGKTYSLSFILVGEKGLYIGRDDLYAEDEDNLSVSVFSFEEN